MRSPGRGRLTVGHAAGFRARSNSSLRHYWRELPVDAAVVAGEHPCVLLVGVGGDHQTRIMSGIYAARRVERQPEQQPEQHGGAERDSDPHRELDDRAEYRGQRR